MCVWDSRRRRQRRCDRSKRFVDAYSMRSKSFYLTKEQFMVGQTQMKQVRWIVKQYCNCKTSQSYQPTYLEWADFTWRGGRKRLRTAVDGCWDELLVAGWNSGNGEGRLGFLAGIVSTMNGELVAQPQAEEWEASSNGKHQAMLYFHALVYGWLL